MLKKIVLILLVFSILAISVSTIYAGPKKNKSWSKIKDIFK